MDANVEETTENSSNHSKSHILVTTVNSTRISNAIEEMRAERLAMATEDKATRDKQTEQMMDMLKNTQQMLTNSFQGPPSFNPIQPQQQFEHQCKPMMTNSNCFQGPPSFNPPQPRPPQPFEHRREQPLAHQQQQHHSQQPSQHQHSPQESPQESPPKLQQLKRKAEKLDCLDKHLLDLPLANQSDRQSHDQTAWINVVTPTDRQAKPEAADNVQWTQRDIRQFFIQPATPRPPAEPGPASRPLVKQAKPRPPAEPVPAPRLQTTQPNIRSHFVRPVAQPAIPRPLAVQIHERRPIPRLRDG